jgi:hypothetical protein
MDPQVQAALLAPSRSWSFRHDVITPDGNVAGQLEVVSCQVKHDDTADIRRTANLTIRPTSAFNFYRDRLRSWARLLLPDGTYAEWAVGTFHLVTSKRTLLRRMTTTVPVQEAIEAVNIDPDPGLSSTTILTNNVAWYTQTADATVRRHGPKSSRTDVVQAGGAAMSWYTAFGLPGTVGLAAVPSRPYTFTVWVKAENANRQAQVILYWRTAGGAAVSQTYGPQTPLVAGEWTQVTVTGSAPATTAGVLVGGNATAITGVTVVGERLWSTDLTVTEGIVPWSFDGDSVAGQDVAFAWAGVPNASTSMRKRVLRGALSAGVVNVCTAPRPSFNQLTGWAGVNSTGNLTSANPYSQNIAAAPGDTVSAVLRLRNVGGAPITLTIAARGTGGGLFAGGGSITNAATVVTVPANSTVEASHVEVLQSPADGFRFLGNVTAGTLGNLVIDLCTLTIGRYTGPAFDGYTAADDTTWHIWTGTPAASTSTRQILDRAAVTTAYEMAAPTVPVTGYDSLSLLAQDAVLDRYVVASGTNYMTAVTTLVSGAGFPTSQLPATTETLPADMDWDPGTSKLRIINDLLAAIDFSRLRMTPMGVPTAAPILEPDDASPVWTYQVDRSSVILPGIDVELDLYDVPNAWVAYISESDRPALRSVYVNDDPNSILSTVNRGRMIVKVLGNDRSTTEDNMSAATQAVLDAKVARAAAAATQQYETAEFDTALMPFHDSGDVVSLDYGEGAFKFVETKWSMDLRAGGKMGHTMQRVVML